MTLLMLLEGGLVQPHQVRELLDATALNFEAKIAGEADPQKILVLRYALAQVISTAEYLEDQSQAMRSRRPPA